MRLWVAIKRGPMAVGYNAATKASWCRLDRLWCLPWYLRQPQCLHAEVLIVAPCEVHASSSGFCEMCKDLRSASFERKHYLTYTVNSTRKEVHRAHPMKHVVPPRVDPSSDEYWLYYPMPMSDQQIRGAIAWLEAQTGKAIGPMYCAYLCCWPFSPREARREDAADQFQSVEAWCCSELVSAMLLLFCTPFAEQTVLDPCATSPCRLEALLECICLAGCPSRAVKLLPVARFGT